MSNYSKRGCFLTMSFYIEFLFVLWFVLNTIWELFQKPAPSSPTDLQGEVLMANNINLAWVNPSTRVDGAVLAATDFTVVVLGKGGSLGNDQTILATLTGDVSSYVVEDAADGVYEFQVFVTDLENRASDLTPVVTVTVATVVVVAAPSAPSSLTATVVTV